MTITEIIEKLNCEIRKSKMAKNIQAVIIYGSWARNTNDEDSDIDIFVICDCIFEKRKRGIEALVNNALEDYKLDVSVYDDKQFQKLLICGSLYLHHLYDEGIIVYAREQKYSKEYLFGKLNEFRGIAEDVLLYERMLEKTKTSLRDKHSNYFDLRMLAMLARNTMIVLCYYMDNHQYGKMEVYNTCKNMFNDEFTFDLDIYSKLMKYRSYYSRKGNRIDLVSDEESAIYIEQVENIIALAKKRIDINNTIDRLYYLFNDNPGHNFYTSFEVFTDFERDLLYYVNIYLNNKYNSYTDSLEEPFLLDLKQKYEEDEFIKCVLGIITDVDEIKKNSSNYSIEFPDVYSPIYKKNNKKFATHVNNVMKHMSKIKLFEKMFGQYTKEDEQDVVEKLQYVRRIIRDELTDESSESSQYHQNKSNLI